MQWHLGALGLKHESRACRLGAGSLGSQRRGIDIGLYERYLTEVHAHLFCIGCIPSVKSRLVLWLMRLNTRNACGPETGQQWQQEVFRQGLSLVVPTGFRYRGSRYLLWSLAGISIITHLDFGQQYPRRGLGVFAKSIVPRKTANLDAMKQNGRCWTCLRLMGRAAHFPARSLGGLRVRRAWEDERRKGACRGMQSSLVGRHSDWSRIE